MMPLAPTGFYRPLSPTNASFVAHLPTVLRFGNANAENEAFNRAGEDPGWSGRIRLEGQRREAIIGETRSGPPKFLTSMGARIVMGLLLLGGGIKSAQYFFPSKPPPPNMTLDQLKERAAKAKQQLEEEGKAYQMQGKQTKVKQ